MAYEKIERALTSVGQALPVYLRQELWEAATAELIHARNALELLENIARTKHVLAAYDNAQACWAHPFETCPDALCKSAREAIGK